MSKDLYQSFISPYDTDDFVLSIEFTLKVVCLYERSNSPDERCVWKEGKAQKKKKKVFKTPKKDVLWTF